MHKYIVFTMQGESWVQHSNPLDSYEEALQFVRNIEHYLICLTINQK